MPLLEALSRNMEEVVTPDEIKALKSTGVKAYFGIEPSGLPHIATGFLWAKKMTEVYNQGIETIVFLADWHAMINDKLDGDLEKIRQSGETILKTMKAFGLPDGVKFVWAKDLVADSDYWKLLLQVAKNSNLSRITRALPIMGRSEEDAEKDFSKFIYPLMQVTDIFYMDLDIAFGGMDQRHAHMLARDIAEKMGKKKVISIHGPLLGSLKGSGRMDTFKKMSKSDPDSAIFISDSREDVNRKLKGAFCPIGQVEGNPVMDLFKHVVFPYISHDITIHRPPSKGGELQVRTFEELQARFLKNEIHPMDLKAAAADSLNEMIEPGRAVFR